jgi:uncharacterized protein (TIGR00369 family)
MANTFPIDIPFLNWMGLEFLDTEVGRSKLKLSLRRHHTNSFSMAHGGVIMTTLDVAMAMAARSLFNAVGAPVEEQYGMVTIEMKTSFMAPSLWSPETGGELVALGICLRRTSQMAFCEAEIVGHDGKLLSKASGTFKAIKQGVRK